MEHGVAFFSLTNLMGGGISLAIGTAAYLFFVRKALWNQKEGYVNRWPAWLDLEELFFRPVFTRFLPRLGCGIAAFLDNIPGSRLIMEWIPRGVTKAFSCLDRLPESRLLMERIPRAAVGIRRAENRPQVQIRCRRPPAPDLLR